MMNYESVKEAYKEDLANHRELFKTLSLIFVATITATIALVYKILIEVVHFKYLFIVLIGIILSAILIIVLMKMWSKMNKLIEELRNVS